MIAPLVRGEAVAEGVALGHDFGARESIFRRDKRVGHEGRVAGGDGGVCGADESVAAVVLG